MRIVKSSITFLCIAAPILMFGQSTYRATYDLSYQIDSTNASSEQTERMYLDFSKNISVFQSFTMHMKDSILQSNIPHALFRIPKSDFLYKIYKTNGQLISLYDYAAYKYEIQENLPSLDWKLGSETKDILGYTCLFATTTFAGRNYTAWYTQDLPVTEGPYKFHGLPGLIIEIYDTKKQYHFKLIGLQKINNEITIENKGYKKITPKEYHVFLKNVEEKPSLILNNPGITIPEEGMRKYDRNQRERNKYKNNPIELTLEK